MAKKNLLRGVAYLALVGCGLGAVSAGALAADAVDLGTVQATTSGGTGSGGGDAAKIDTAPYQAPSQTPLDVTQPTSVVSQHFIENSVVQVGNYDDAIKFTPSFSNVEPNGPGLQESKFINMRGFQDGQYNLTYDGIPLAGSPTSFHHESGVYFMEHDLGGVQIDRGPGTASTVGNATFGGTINLLSKDPLTSLSAGPYSTFGSFNTRLVGTEADSGSIKEWNGASFIADAERLNSDGFLTDSSSQRTNAYGKGIVPVGEDTVVSFVGMVNHTDQHVPSGATIQELNQNGYNFGLNNNPNSNNFAGYNFSTYATDLEYVGVQSNLGDGWQLDNKVYTDFFSHISVSSSNNADLASDFTNLSTSYNVNGKMLTAAQIATGAYKNQILGSIGSQEYRAWGDMLRLSKDVSFGQLRAGLWFDRTDNSYSKLNVDLSDNSLAEFKCSSASIASCAPAGANSYLLRDWANTIQGYAEADWKPLNGLTLTPGVKVTSYRLSENATFNSGNGLPNKASQSWDAVLPSLNANYVILPGWSAYAQVAEGFQAPPLNAMFSGIQSSVAPATTWNYQVGTVWKNDRVSLSADAYYIDFGNYYTSYQDAAKDTLYASAGSATYKGVELEGTYHLGWHLSLYGNATFNSATYANGQWIANAPIGTGAFGLVYQDHDGIYGSLLGKAVGRQEGTDSFTVSKTAQPNQIDQLALPTYTYADFAIGYTLKNDDGAIPLFKSMNLGLKVNNIFDQHSLIGYAGTDASTNPLYWVMPGRSFFGTVEVKF